MRCYECDNDPCRCYGDVAESEWTSSKDALPEKHQYVLLLADRYWNVPDGVPDMKVTAQVSLGLMGIPVGCAPRVGLPPVKAG